MDNIENTTIETVINRRKMKKPIRDNFDALPLFILILTLILLLNILYRQISDNTLMDKILIISLQVVFVLLILGLILVILGARLNTHKFIYFVFNDNKLLASKQESSYNLLQLTSKRKLFLKGHAKKLLRSHTNLQTKNFNFVGNISYIDNKTEIKREMNHIYLINQFDNNLQNNELSFIEIENIDFNTITYGKDILSEEIIKGNQVFMDVFDTSEGITIPKIVIIDLSRITR